jgi:hypothetical protein
MVERASIAREETARYAGEMLEARLREQPTRTILDARPDQ